MALTGDWSVELPTYADLLNYLEKKLREAVATPDIADPMAKYLYLNQRRDAVVQAAKQRPLLRLWDKNMNYIADLAGERSVVVEEVAADSGTATVVIRHSNWLSNFILYDRRAEEDLHFTLDPDPYKRSWKTRWGGKIVNVNAVRDEDGLHTVELEMMHNREHAKHLLCGANPVFPPEIQLPKMYFMPWNIRTALFITTFINLARQFFPLLSIPDNIANPGAWLGIGDIVGGFSPLAWPIQPQFVNPLFDQSRTSVITSRWQDLHTVSQQPMKDAGVILRAYTWLKEDDTSPHPELGKLGDALARPWRNAVILAFEDKSSVTGPTDTLIDGPINLIASTADDLITETLLPASVVDKDKDGVSDPLIRKWLGVAPAPPKVVFRDGEHTGIVSAKRSIKGATAKTIMVGSRSPGWVNQLQTFGIKFGLAQLQLVITEGIFAQQGQAPIGSGLEELYQGQLDDTLLAWQRFTDLGRAIRMGDFGYLEHFESGSGSAWTVSAVLDLRTGHWKTRASTSFKTSIRNGRPWSVDEHFTLGDRLAFQLGNTLHTDQLTGIKRSYDASTPMTIELSLGRDIAEDDPFARGMATLAQVWSSVGLMLGQGTIF